MNIRKSTLTDLDDIMLLIHQAQAYFKKSGIDQWQDGYPQKANICSDIKKEKSYVLVDQTIIGTMYFAIEDDPNYKVIDGQWLTQQQPYAVIHRIVVDENKKGHNLASLLLQFVINECLQQNVHSIRIDTHTDNQSMKSFLRKNGFINCGHITLESGAPRIGFEKILNK